MKTETAVIKLQLLTSRAKANGEYPIVLTICYGGRKDQYTGYTSSIENWDKKNERLKSKHPNAASINQIITELKNNAIAKKLEYERENIPYTPSMLFEEKKALTGNKYCFRTIVENLIKERHLKYNTSKTYYTMFKRISQYMKKDDFLITELTPTLLTDFVYDLKNVMTEGSIKTIMEKLYSVWHYAQDNELVSYDMSAKYKYWTTLRSANKKQAITKEQIERLFNTYTNMVSYTDIMTNETTILPDALNKLQRRGTKETALALFLISYHSQGLALTDLAKLKLQDIETINYQDEKYYIIKTYRDKTNVPVTIAIKQTNITKLLFTPFITTASNRDNYLFPIYQNKFDRYKYTTDKDFQQALMNTNRYITINLKKVIDICNRETDEYCAKTKQDTPEHIPYFSFYAARHTFATVYMQQDGSNPVHLATMMGRSVNNIFGYVKQLQTVEDIIKERNKMF